MSRLLWSLATCTLASTMAQPAVGQTPLVQQLGEKFQSSLVRLAEDAPGVVGIAVVDIATGERFGVNEDLVFAQGSAIKIPLLIELFRQADEGALRLSERVTIDASTRTGGSSLLQHFTDGGSALSLHDLAIPMIVLSDNTATNILAQRLGMQRITHTMSELGAPQTKFQRLMIRPEESVKGNENISTPAEAAALMMRLEKCDLPVSQESCAEIKRILSIPKPSAFTEPIPSSVPVAWKPGGLEGVATAWGLVSLPGRPYSIAVMVNYGPADMTGTIREVSGAAYEYFSQMARTTPYGTRVPLQYVPR